jgi:DNA-binding transcriptional regulator YiaG
MVNFPQKVKLLREKLILSQMEFADLIGVSFSTVNRWENGKSQPPYKHRRKIAELCEQQGIRIDE